MKNLNLHQSTCSHLKQRIPFILSLTILFATTFIQRGFAQGWTFESQRDQISPRSYTDSKVTFHNKPTLGLAGGGKDYADGHWSKTVAVDAGQYYQFKTFFKTNNVEEPGRCIQGRIIWLDNAAEQVGFTEYPVTASGKSPEGWNVMEKLYQVPSPATKAKLELHYRWDADGTVNFTEATFERTAAPAPRKVKLATVFHRPRNSKSPQDNLEQFSALVKKAADQKADIVCLPEGITLVGTTLNYVSASEPVPGKTTDYLGNVARQHNIYIVAGILEKDGDVIYNTAVLIDRKGNLAGKYRKVSLPREEIDGGVTPGDATPVFDTDFGRIGIMICWDVTFPETARALARQGAEVIFLPIWGGYVKLAMARALENQVYLVSSSYDMISAVFDLEGNVLKEATTGDPVIVTEVDLNQQKLWPWIGDLKSRIPREMPTEKAVDVGSY
jgi:predicted amidohydrolase